MASQLFLISYILDDQPMTCELHSEADTLSREEARRHLQALHRPHDAEAISDIQVSKVNRAARRDTTSSPDGGREKEGGRGSAGAGLEFRLELAEAPDFLAQVEDEGAEVAEAAAL